MPIKTVKESVITGYTELKDTFLSKKIHLGESYVGCLVTIDVSFREESLSSLSVQLQTSCDGLTL